MKNFAKKHKNMLMLVFSGVLTGSTLVFPHIGFFEWFSLIPACVALITLVRDEGVKLKKIYFSGLLFFMSYYIVIFHWFVYMYPLEFTGISKIAAAFVVVLAWIGLSLFQSLISAFLFVIFAFVCRFDTVKKLIYVQPFFAAAIWCVFEWVQTVGWWGVPWGRLGLGQIEAPLLLRSSSLFGSYFVTFIIVAVNFCIAYFFLAKSKKKAFLRIAVCAFCLNVILGSAVTLTYREKKEKVKFAAVQGNIDSSEKWSVSSLDKTLYVYRKYTIEAAEDGAQVILWPETAIPYDLFNDYDLELYVSTLAIDAQSTLLVSTFTDGDEGYYNSLIEVKPDGSFGDVIYNKQRLVPFGEFVPMRKIVSILFSSLGELGMVSDLAAGDKSAVISSEAGEIGCGICFDSIYENIIRESVLSGAEIIVISTNDSWFGDSAALKMHNSQSVLRAIENGRYVVRAANTGISSVIDPMGNVISRLGANREGYLVKEVDLREDITLYTRIGNVFVYCCAAFVIVCVICGFIERHNKPKTNLF